jgi:hypothetical protein
MRKPSPVEIAGLFWLVAIVIAALFGWSQRARAQNIPPSAWIVPYDDRARANEYGAKYDHGREVGANLSNETRGDLYAFCDAEWTQPCNTHALMLKDVCEKTLREWTDGSKRFSCAPVNAATRDAYLATVDKDVRERTIEAWAAGR